VRRANRPMHDRSSSLAHDGQGLFDGLPFRVGRRCLIVALDESCAPKPAVPARSEEGEMALTHRDHPIYGAQFHSQSILTQPGEGIL
jgi:para-aminobenzoate synthetase component II